MFSPCMALSGSDLRPADGWICANYGPSFLLEENGELVVGRGTVVLAEQEVRQRRRFRGSGARMEAAQAYRRGGDL